MIKFIFGTIFCLLVLMVAGPKRSLDAISFFIKLIKRPFTKKEDEVHLDVDRKRTVGYLLDFVGYDNILEPGVDISLIEKDEVKRSVGIERPSESDYFVAYSFRSSKAWEGFQHHSEGSPGNAISALFVKKRMWLGGDMYFFDHYRAYNQDLDKPEDRIDIWQKRSGVAALPKYTLYFTDQDSYHITGGTQLARLQPFLVKELDGITTIVDQSELSNHMWSINDEPVSEDPFINLFYPFVGEEHLGTFYDPALPEYKVSWTPSHSVNLIKTTLAVDFEGDRYMASKCSTVRWSSGTYGDVVIENTSTEYIGCQNKDWDTGMI